MTWSRDLVEEDNQNLTNQNLCIHLTFSKKKVWIHKPCHHQISYLYYSLRFVYNKLYLTKVKVKTKLVLEKILQLGSNIMIKPFTSTTWSKCLVGCNIMNVNVHLLELEFYELIRYHGKQMMVFISLKALWKLVWNMVCRTDFVAILNKYNSFTAFWW